jgi:hypothetical protein
MPVLKKMNKDTDGYSTGASLEPTGGGEAGQRRVEAGFRHGLLQACANPRCGSGWLHLLRSRSRPVFEGGWSCSAPCTVERIEMAVRRELDGRGSLAEPYRHRVPLGLIMMEKGWINAAQLRSALDAQKGSGGRLGQCLISGGGVSEREVTRALSLQWSCPVIPLGFHDPEPLSVVMPRLFVDAFGALPLRIAAGKLMYLGFEERLDPVLALAVERMSGLRVESGLVADSEFRPAHARMLSAAFPPVELVEASSEPVLVRVLARAVERARPFESRLVRVHDCLWLRMWGKAQAGPLPDTDSVRDMICTVGAAA